MRYAIISNGCPLCLAAKNEYAGGPLEEFADWLDVPRDRRDDMILSVIEGGGDPNKLPLMFRNDEWFDHGAGGGGR